MKLKTSNELLAHDIVPSQVFQRWDTVKNFYGMYQKAKSNIGLVVVNDQKSWNELIEKLNQQESNGG